MFFVRILNIMYRELTLILKDKILISIVFITPIAYSLLFGFIYIDKRVLDIPIYIIDEDRTASSLIVKQCLRHDEYIEIIDETKTYEEFLHDLHYEKVYGCLIIPKGFERDLKRGKKTQIAGVIEASNMIISNTLSKAFIEIAATVNVGIEMKKLNMKGTPKEHLQDELMPVSSSVRLLSNPTLNYMDFLVPGLIGTIAQQIALLSVALGFSREREKKKLKSLTAITSSPLEALIGKGAFYSFVNYCMASFAFYMIFTLFGVKFTGSLVLFMSLLLIFICALVSFGLIVSSLLKDSLVVMEVLMMIAVPSFLISGYTWPQFCLPPPLLCLSNALPLTHFVLAMRQIVILGAPFDAVKGHFIFLAAVFVLGYTGAYFCVKKIMRET